MLNSKNPSPRSRRAIVAVALAMALLGVPSVVGLAGARAQVSTTSPQNGQQQVTTITTAAPPSTTAPPVTSAPVGSQSSSTASTTSSTAPGGTTTGPGGATTAPGGGTSGGTTAGGSAGVLGGKGARGAFNDLVHGHPGRAARRAVGSAVREVGDLSPLQLALLGLLLLFVLVPVIAGVGDAATGDLAGAPRLAPALAAVRPRRRALGGRPDAAAWRCSPRYPWSWWW